MKVKEHVTIYQCDHCKKKLFRKHAMEKHEKWCPSNPENRRACEGCIHLEEITVDVYYDGRGEYPPVKAKGFRCKVQDKLLYPVKVEQKRLPEKYPETFEDQGPMPKRCEIMEGQFSEYPEFDF